MLRRSERLLDDTPAGTRGSVLVLYAIRVPTVVGVLLLTALPERRWPYALALLAALLPGAAWVALRRTPSSADFSFTAALVPIVSGALGYLASGGRVPAFLAVPAGALIGAATICEWRGVLVAWLAGTAMCFAVTVGTTGAGPALAGAVLYGVVQGSAAWLIHRRTEHGRVMQLQALHRQLNDVELLVRDDGVIVDANDRAAEAYRTPLERLIGMPVRDLRPPELREAVDAHLCPWKQGGVVFETEHVRADGSRFPVEVSARACVFAGRTYRHAVVRDISARRAVEEQRRFLATLFAQMHEAVIVLDERFLVKLWSPGAERMFGWTAGEVMGRSPFDFQVPPEDAGATGRAIAEVAAGREFTRVARLRRKDGEERLVSVNMVALLDATGAISGILSVARDVTAQVAAEAERERLLREAQRATLAREQMLAVVAHDLRNPLAAIVSAGQDLEQALEARDPRGDLAGRAELIAGATGRMSRLIEDLLDVAAIQNGNLRLVTELHAPARVAHEAIRVATPLAARAGVALALEVDDGAPPLRCDRGRLLQVLGNLLANAIQATPRGGTVTLRLALEGGTARFTVEDTGKGFGEGQVERLFQPYQRGEGTAYKGTGLGLAIARGIVEGHGGRIWAEPRASGGARFEFTVPAACRPELH